MKVHQPHVGWKTTVMHRASCLGFAFLLTICCRLSPDRHGVMIMEPASALSAGMSGEQVLAGLPAAGAAAVRRGTADHVRLSLSDDEAARILNHASSTQYKHYSTNTKHKDVVNIRFAPAC